MYFNNFSLFSLLKINIGKLFASPKKKKA